VILSEVSFTLLKGHTKIIPGRERRGKSTISRLIHRPAQAGRRRHLGKRRARRRACEKEMMGVGADLGMVFQEGALFDSLTGARERRLQAVRGDSQWPEQRQRAGEECSDSSARRVHRRCRRSSRAASGGASRSPRAMAAKPRILLYDEPTTGLDPITATTVDDEIVKLRDIERRELDRRHAPAAPNAFYDACHQARPRQWHDPGSKAANETQVRDEAEVLHAQGIGKIIFERACRRPASVHGPVLEDVSFMKDAKKMRGLEIGD
jgi:phospholipid/cholesterol/gamma-HCH transport system ATP-binding protein